MYCHVQLCSMYIIIVSSYTLCSHVISNNMYKHWGMNRQCTCDINNDLTECTCINSGRAELVLGRMCHNSPGRGEGSDRHYSNTVGSEGPDACTRTMVVVVQPRPLLGGGHLGPSLGLLQWSWRVCMRRSVME